MNLEELGRAMQLHEPNADDLGISLGQIFLKVFGVAGARELLRGLQAHHPRREEILRTALQLVAAHDPNHPKNR